MAPKFALFTNGSKLPLNQGFQNRFLVTTVSRQALDTILISGETAESPESALIVKNHLNIHAE